jgi:predicted RNA-binding protein YlxR (DUF448 family)
MTEKTYPQRTCVGCRQIKDKKALLRIVHTPEDTFRLDASGKAKGRGAYVCPDRNCIEAAFKKGALEKSLRCRIPKEAQDEIIRELTEFENQNT